MSKDDLKALGRFIALVSASTAAAAAIITTAPRFVAAAGGILSRFF